MAGLIAVTIAKPTSAVTVTVTGAAAVDFSADALTIAVTLVVLGAGITVIAGCTSSLRCVNTSFYRVTGIDSAGFPVVTGSWCVCTLASYALVDGACIVVFAVTVAGAAIRLWRVHALIVDARISSACIVVFAVVVSQTSTNQPCRVAVSNSRTV